MTQEIAVKAAREASPTVHVGPPKDGIREMLDTLAQRAFSIFQSKGESFGNDLANWLQAERELFHPAHIDVAESDQGFTVKAEVPGFTPKDLEVNLEGTRLTISGKREKHEERKDKKTIYSETCSDQILRVVDLPAEVNAEGASATVKDGVLSLELPKAAPARGAGRGTRPGAS